MRIINEESKEDSWLNNLKQLNKNPDKEHPLVQSTEKQSVQESPYFQNVANNFDRAAQEANQTDSHSNLRIQVEQDEYQEEFPTFNEKDVVQAQVKSPKNLNQALKKYQQSEIQLDLMGLTKRRFIVSNEVQDYVTKVSQQAKIKAKREIEVYQQSQSSLLLRRPSQLLGNQNHQDINELDIVCTYLQQLFIDKSRSTLENQEEIEMKQNLRASQAPQSRYRSHLNHYDKKLQDRNKSTLSKSNQKNQSNESLNQSLSVSFKDKRGFASKISNVEISEQQDEQKLSKKSLLAKIESEQDLKYEIQSSPDYKKNSKGTLVKVSVNDILSKLNDN